MTFSPIDYALHCGSGCRDCADADGTCPTHGLPCNPKVFRAVVEHTLKAWTYGIEHGFMENPFSSPGKDGGQSWDDPTLDGTDGAHPAWWRGCDHGYAKGLASAGKDGGQEVEAVAWSERENAFTDFWEQCPKLVDASDVGKARQAFFAGMDAASFFDSMTQITDEMKVGQEVEAVGWETDAERDLENRAFSVANNREVPEHIRTLVEDLWRQYCIAAEPQPASTALVERLRERGQAFANQVRRITHLLHGQAYSTTVAELNAFDAALSASQSTSRENAE